MTLTLLLLRHAKSSWDTPDMEDFERPLAKRGIAAAPQIGRYIRREGLVPDLVLSSTSVRTRATLALALPEIGAPPPEIHYEDGLYLASAGDILERVRGIGAKARRVLVVGHNPGMHGAALTLVGDGPRKALASLAMKFPTAALAVFDFDLDRWSAVRPATGRLTHFVTPRELAAGA